MIEEEIAKIRDYALKLLTFRPRSTREIEDKLKVFIARKKLSPNYLPEVIEWLKKENFLNDEEFVKWWIAARQKNKPKGRIVISQELICKGIDKELISENLGLTTKEKETEIAFKFIQKKLANKKFTSKMQMKIKINGLLARRGFSYEVIKAVIDLYQSKKLK